MRGDELVGIITDGNIFEILMEMLGARNAGLRVSVLTDEREGMLYHLTKAIFEAGGNIVSMSTFLGESTTSREVVIKVSGVEQETILAAVKPLVREILHVHQVTV
jgi:acetoin utilization protein AcuB